jgi:hypothetical protein
MSTTPPLLRTDEPAPAPAPAAPRVAGSGYLECDFCHCKLTKVGEVYQVSDVARQYRDAEEKHKKQMEKTDEEIAKLRALIAAKDAELAALKGSPAQEHAGITVG